MARIISGHTPGVVFFGKQLVPRKNNNFLNADLSKLSIVLFFFDNLFFPMRSIKIPNITLPSSRVRHSRVNRLVIRTGIPSKIATNKNAHQYAVLQWNCNS